MADDTTLDRHGLEVLSEEQCNALLEEAEIGRLAFLYDRRPLILPVNYALDEARIVVRTASGTKLDAAVKRPGGRVAFEIDGYDEDSRTGWSVVVQGRLEPILDRTEVARLDRLDLAPWADAVERRRWIAVVPERTTGRRIVHGEPD